MSCCDDDVMSHAERSVKGGASRCIRTGHSGIISKLHCIQKLISLASKIGIRNISRPGDNSSAYRNHIRK